MTLSSLAKAEEIVEHMEGVQRRADAMLAAQKLAAGDDSHYYRDSLIEFVRYTATFDKRTAVAVVDDYLIRHSAASIPRRMKRRFRETLFGRISLEQTPEQLAAAWKCFMGRFE